MKLVNVKISDYKSVIDSNEFTIDDITCLVGKNESGKTAILEAIQHINPYYPVGKLDYTDHYPRSTVSEYVKQRENDLVPPAKVIIANFLLEDIDISDIEHDYPGIIDEKNCIITLGYETLFEVQLFLNEDIFIELLSKEGLLNEEERGEFSSFKKIDSIPEEFINNLSDQGIKKIIEEVNSAGSLSKYVYDIYLKLFLPKFMYFDDYNLLKGIINLEKFIQRINNNNLNRSDYPLLGLLQLANLEPGELLDLTRSQEVFNKLEGAGNSITFKMMNYWSTNRNLELRFRILAAKAGDPEGYQQGNNLWCEVFNQKHRASTNLSERSRGFVWFFSFLAWYASVERKDYPRIIFLFDEPGLNLHGKAQNDLLTYIKKELIPNHQVIYTTHSPFMIDPQNFQSVRIVEDKGGERFNLNDEEARSAWGTKVFTDVLVADEYSLFPLRDALGYDLTQTLFIGPNCLVVEGISDYIYLNNLSLILERKGRTYLDRRWVITPVGGFGKVSTFASLLRHQKDLNIVILLDYEKKNQQEIENLYKTKILIKDHVLTYKQFAKDNKREADIEDLFAPDFYLKLFNGEYGENISSGKLRVTLRIIKEIERQRGGEFSHLRPARYFTDNISTLSGELSDDTLNRFEKMFEHLNSLLVNFS